MNLINEILFNLSMFSGYGTERVVNLVWKAEGLEEEEANTVIRVFSYRHEKSLIEKNISIAQISVAQATALSCPLDRLGHEHGCYSEEY